MPDTIKYAVQVNLPKDLPDNVKPRVHVYDQHGKFIASAGVDGKGAARLELPGDLVGSALRLAVSAVTDETPTLRDLRRAKAVERLVPFDPRDRPVFDIPDILIPDWILCVCTVRGRVVKAVPQPSGEVVDYPVCNARVHICEVDRFPRIVIKLPDHIIERIRDELLIEPPFPPDPIGPVIRERFPRPPVPPGPGPGPLGRSAVSATPIPLPSPRLRTRQLATAAATAAAAPGRSAIAASAPAEYTRLIRAQAIEEVRSALIDLGFIHPWWCWFPWLDPFWRYEVDCLWTAMTNENGEFSRTIIYPCDDQPDIYLWVEQFIGGSWKTIYARGPRCDTHWNYACGSVITIHVTHPDAIACVPPPEVEIPEGITTWVLPMAVGDLEIAGKSSHPGELGWLQSDGTASYGGGPANIDPITDAPMGGYLRFKMLHSLDLPKAAMPRYSWSYRPRPTNPTDTGGWIKMTDTITRRYQIPGPGGFPLFPVVTLGPDPDELFAFRPHTPPAGVWPVNGFTEDLWSAKLDTGALDPGLYQVRVTVHDGAGAVVAPSAGTFTFVATDTRLGGETFSSRAAVADELIDDGFVFDVLIDNAGMTAVLNPTQTGVGGVADACGFLRYTDKTTTDVTMSFEASHPRDHGWFTLEVVRGLTGLPQVEVMDGGLVGATLVPVDTNGGGTWGDMFYTGDGNGNFSGTCSAGRLLEACDNGAFAVDLYARAKAHNGERRLNEYDRHALMAFALAEDLPPTP